MPLIQRLLGSEARHSDRRLNLLRLRRPEQNQQSVRDSAVPGQSCEICFAPPPYLMDFVVVKQMRTVKPSKF